MTCSSIRLCLCLAILLGGWADTTGAVEPGFKLGLSINDQFSNSIHTDTQADRQIVPTLFVGFRMDPWRWVPTMSFLQKSNQRLTYLSFQSDVHYTFPLGNAEFYLLAAPRLDVLLSDGPGAATGSEPVTAGVSLGLGQDISLGKDVLFMEFRYDRDLTAYWHRTGEMYSPWSYETLNSDWYNRLFIVQLGVRVNASRAHKESESPELWPRR